MYLSAFAFLFLAIMATNVSSAAPSTGNISVAFIMVGFDDQDFQDEYDKDEMSFVKAIEKTWQYLSTPQKYVLFMRTVLGLTFSSIAKTEGYSTQNAHKLFERACKVIRENM